MLFACLCQIPPTTDAEFEALRPKFREYSLPNVHIVHNFVHSSYYNRSADRREPHGNPNLDPPWDKPVGMSKTYGDVFTKTYRYFPHYPEINGLSWRFYQKTVFCEVFYQRYEGEEYPWLILTRTRDKYDWIPAAYMPVTSIEELRYYYGVAPEPRTWTLRVADDFGVIDAQKRSVPALPPMSPQTVKALLSQPFQRQDSYFSDQTFAPFAPHTFSLGPTVIGAVDLDAESCNRCHNTAGMSASTFYGDRNVYGHVRGDDGIFSWHPFAESSISHNGHARPVSYRGVE